MIQKLEQGYLQLLRIVLLILATVAIGAACVLGARYALEHDVKPAPVSDEVKFKLDAYKPPAGDSSVSEGGEQEKPKGEQKDALFEDYAQALTQFIKASGADITPNRQGMRNSFNSIVEEKALGRPFVKLLIPLIQEASKNKPIMARARLNVTEEFGHLLSHFIEDYKDQRAVIEAKKVAASTAADETKAGALVSLYAAGVGFLVFAGLVLLIVLLKIERNLRVSTISPVAEH